MPGSKFFFPGFGWMEFDPTSQIPAPGEEFQFAPFSTQELEPYLKEILENRDMLKVAELAEGSIENGGSARQRGLAVYRPVLFGLKAFLALLALVLFFRIARRFVVLTGALISKKKASSFYHIHMALAESLVRKRSKDESFQDYVQSLNDCSDDKTAFADLKEMTELFERIRFGRSSLEDLQTLTQLGASVRTSLYKNAPKRRKVASFFVLFLKRRLP